MANLIKFLKLQNKCSRPVFYSLSFSAPRFKKSDEIPLGLVMPNACREYDLSKDLVEKNVHEMDEAQISLKVRGIYGSIVSFGIPLTIGFQSTSQAVLTASGNAQIPNLHMNLNGVDFSNPTPNVIVAEGNTPTSKPKEYGMDIANTSVSKAKTQEKKSSEKKMKLVSRVSWRKSAEGFNRYVRQLDEYLATKAYEIPEEYDPNHVVGGTGIVVPENEVLLTKIVLNAPKFVVGGKFNFAYSVKEGAASLEKILIQSSGNKSVAENSVVAAGTYVIHVFLSPKKGYAFEVNGGAPVCDVTLVDGTKLEPFGIMTVNEKKWYHFRYKIEMTSIVVADDVRYVSCTNKGAYVAKLRIHYQKPSSTTWESTTLTSLSLGQTQKYDLVSQLGLPANTLIQAELVVTAGFNKKSDKILRVNSGTTKIANYTCSGTTLNNSLTLNIESGVAVAKPVQKDVEISRVVLNAPKWVIGEKVSFGYTVKEGAVTVERVLVQSSDNRSVVENSVISAGTYTVHVYLYQKTGYTFKEANGSAVCDVMLADGTKLASSSHATVNGKNCCHFSYNVKIQNTIISKVVLNAPPQLKAGNQINFDYTVKEGPVTVEWVLFVRASDNKFINYKKEYPVVAGGEKYTVHVYLYQKTGYAFNEVNGNAVCDVSLADGTKLVSSSHATANGKNCCHFSYELTIPSAVTSDHVRYVNCTNKGLFATKLRIHYQKPGSTSWESVTLGSILAGNKKTYDLVSELNLPLDTLFKVEVVVVGGRNNKSNRILKVHSGTTKSANYTCSGTTLSNKLALEIK